LFETELELVAPSEQIDIEIDRELSSRGFNQFVRLAWPFASPQPLVETFHVDAIAEHLQAVGDRQIQNLIINVPPGCSKSMLTCVLWTPWEWSRKPSTRWFFFSYTDGLSSRDSSATRELVTSDWYRKRWPGVRLRRNQNQKTYYETTAGGYRMASTTQGRATGEHPNYIVGDDPHNVAGSQSKKEREGDVEWWDQTMSSRGLSMRVQRVIVMQRLHTKDLTGHILSEDLEGEWEHLLLPMRYERNRSKTTVIGFSDPRKVDGELLAPRLLPDPIVRGLERKLGTYGTAGQLQQRPVIREGAMFKTDRFQVIPRQEFSPARMIRLVRAWDKAGTKDAGCYTAGVLWGLDSDENPFIVDVVRDRWSTEEVESQMDLWSRLDELKYRRDRAETVFEQEPGASGIHSAKVTLKRLQGRRVRAMLPQGSKIIRAEPMATAINLHEVRLVEGPWNADFIEELQAFPNGEYADQVDAGSLGYTELTAGNVWTLPADNDGEEATAESRFATSKACCNPLCDRLALGEAGYCCGCCQAAHAGKTGLSAGDHSPVCNDRHGQMYAKNQWEPAARI